MPERPWPVPHPRPSAPRSPTAAVSRPSDVEILAALQRGAEWAADQLYDRTHAHIERTLRRLLRYHRGEQDDLMQASFERMLRFLSDRTLAGTCNLPAWASAVAANVALDHLRKRARERKLFDPEGALEAARSPEAGPERSADARAAAARLHALLGRMKPKYAETVVLHDVLGHDLAEIAEMTGASVAAAQSRLVRGRKDLLRRAKEWS